MDPNQNRSVPILTTKLNMPLQKPNLVVRQALIDRLSEGLRHNNSLFLVSAPAGYGKTTLICEWLNSESFRHAWLSLDEKDNDPVRFLTYMLAAFRKIIPKAGQVTQSLCDLPQLPPVDVLITPLINDLTGSSERLVLVLDDYHLINNRYIHDIIQFILSYRPNLLYLVLITREDPSLALPRMRACGTLTEIRASDLRFSDDETAAFMGGIMRLNLEKEAIVVLNMMTEGWIAGLQLAALSMQGHTQEEIDSFLIDFSSSNRYILDYLVSEVLANLSEAIRDFLRRTAVLDRLCAALCDAVTGREDSQQLLKSLKQSNLFLFPLDKEDQWYRYHHLFADSLRKELSLEEQRIIHQKAARWYEADGYLEEAVIQAIAAADYREAGRLIELVGDEFFSNGGLTTLNDWLDALPDAFVCSRGELVIYKMIILYFMGQIETSEHYISTLEDPQIWSTINNQSRFYMVCAALANARDDPQGLQLSEESLALANKDLTLEYVGILNTYGQALRNTGNLTEAVRVFREAFELRKRLGNVFITTYAFVLLLSTLELNGRLSEALALGEKLVAEMMDFHGAPSPLAKLVYLPLGMFYYKANRLDQALKYLTEGSALFRILSANGLLNGEHILAQVYQAFGEPQKALSTIRKAIRRNNPSAQSLAAFDNAALEAELLLRRGELKSAIDWANYWRLTSDDKPTLSREQSYFTFVRLLITQQRFPEAFDLLEYLEDSTQAGQRYSRLITVYILQSLACHHSGDESQSLQYLSQALMLAAPGGYYRPFLDEEPRIQSMLIKIQPIEPEFVTELLVAFAKSSLPLGNLGVTTAAGLIELLSNREMELLRLVATGMSNPSPV